MVAVPVADPDLAVMIAVPGISPVTVPSDATRATALLLDDHETDVLMMAPEGSRTTAVSFTVPSTPMVAVSGITCTVRTPAPTVTVAVPTWFSLVAEIVAVPADTPVTTPVLSTAATDA